MYGVLVLPRGLIDGVNTNFETPVDYLPGSVRVFSPLLEVVLVVTENGGKSFSLSEPPQAGDLIYIFYIPIN